MDSEVSITASPAARPKLNPTISRGYLIDHKSENRFHENRSKRLMRNSMTDDYMDLVGDIMYPKSSYETFPEEQKLPYDKFSTLGYLLSPIRDRTVIEKWSPYDIAIFEASITLYGKNFHLIQKHISNKSCKEIIEFYYEWKKTNHYDQWKSNYKSYLDERELHGLDEDFTF